MAHLKRTGILLRWARGSNCKLLVMLSAHFHMCFIVSWAKATAPTRIYCTQGRSNYIHTYGKNKGPCISLSPYEKALERWQSECTFQFFAPFFDELLAFLVWNHMNIKAHLSRKFWLLQTEYELNDADIFSVRWQGLSQEQALGWKKDACLGALFLSQQYWHTAPQRL